MLSSSQHSACTSMTVSALLEGQTRNRYGSSALDGCCNDRSSTDAMHYEQRSLALLLLLHLRVGHHTPGRARSVKRLVAAACVFLCGASVHIREGLRDTGQHELPSRMLLGALQSAADVEP